MIETKELCFAYEHEQPIIEKLNISIKKSDKVTIIGKSGCGKSTLLFLLGGILKPNYGQIIIDGEALRDYRQSTSIIFQNGGLFPWKTVYQNLALGLKVRGLKQSEIKTKIEVVLDELQIKGIKNKFIKQLSGGEKQRVSIARSLVLDSDLLLLDEPSSSLDAMTKEQFQKTMLELYNQHELTSVMVTHDIFEAVYLGQKIMIMKDGRIDAIIENDLYGNEDVKDTLAFYQKCIEIKEMLK